jgi:hypothetical protein
MGKDAGLTNEVIHKIHSKIKWKKFDNKTDIMAFSTMLSK